MKQLIGLLCLLSTPLFADGQPAPQPTSFADSLLPIKNADDIVRDFRTKYTAANKPRFLIYINRDLVQSRGEMVEALQVQHSTQVKGDTVTPSGEVNIQVGSNTNTPASNSSSKNAPSPVVTGQGGEQQATASLSVRVLAESNKGVAPINDYEARHIEETFSDRFSQGGTHFVDQRVAETLLKPFAPVGDRFLTAPTSDAEKDEIEALKKSADVVIEILARHKTVVVPTPAGSSAIDRLDLSVTAIDLRQAGLILGRASSDSLFGFNKRDGLIREQQASVLTSEDFLDQLSLALMDRLSF